MRAVAQYRFYRLNGNNYVSDSSRGEYESDTLALEAARNIWTGDFTEVWQLGRLVGRSRDQIVVPYDDHRLKVVPNYGAVD